MIRRFLSIAAMLSSMFFCTCISAPYGQYQLKKMELIDKSTGENGVDYKIMEKSK